MSTAASQATADRVATVNGVALHAPTENLDPVELRQRACTELLRQAAQRAGLLSAHDVALHGIPSEAAVAAIEQLLERDLNVPEPTEEDCRRHHAHHAARYRVGERVRLRHILFAVTPGVNLPALRQRAEQTLLEVRNHDGSRDVFADAARACSNCPSAAHGGDLGWLQASECAPEFARAVFGHPEVGVLPRLVHSRHGLHVVEVLQREPGVIPAYEAVQPQVRALLRQQRFATALRHFLDRLATQACMEGLDLGLNAPHDPLLD